MVNKKDTHKIEIDVKNRLITVDGYETAFAYPVIANHERIDVYFDIPMYYKSKLLYAQKVNILKSIWTSKFLSPFCKDSDSVGSWRESVNLHF